MRQKWPIADWRVASSQVFCGFLSLQVSSSFNPSSNPDDRNLSLTLASSSSNHNNQTLKHGQDSKVKITARGSLNIAIFAWESVALTLALTLRAEP